MSPCDMCDGDTVVLGHLGGTVHLRCRACGWQMEANMDEGASVWCYQTGAYVRPATSCEWAASVCAGETGVIEIDGELVFVR
jgi:hypothetical protein